VRVQQTWGEDVQGRVRSPQHRGPGGFVAANFVGCHAALSMAAHCKPLALTLTLVLSNDNSMGGSSYACLPQPAPAPPC
jgi:hypothetical protein